MAVHKIDGVDGVNHYPKKFVRLYGTAAITAGNWVQIETDTSVTDYDKNDVGASVTTADAVANGNMAVLGIATETTTAAGYITIQTAGRYESANVATSVAAGSALVVDDTSAGRAVLMVAADVPGPCGLCLVLAASNMADVLITDQGYF